MKLPIVSRDFATSQWIAYSSGEEPIPASENIDYLGPEDDQILNEVELEDLIDGLDMIRQKYDEMYPKGFPKSVGGRVESDLVEIVHSTLSEFATPGQLSHIGFWRWLSNVAYKGYFWRFIDWRFKERNQINWALTSSRNLKETLFFRCWIRGQKMHDSMLPDPYEYSKKGTGDFWRSHLLRTDLGKDRAFVKAFLDFNFEPDGTRRISDTALRGKLIPGIRAWSSMATFTHLSYEECTAIISRIWEIEENR